MRGAERGFLLLTSHLGDPCCKPLTVAQFRTLTARVRAMERPEGERMLTAEDLMGLGYQGDFACNILYLLSREEQLEYYVNQAKNNGCVPITRLSDSYPRMLRHCLGTDCPGCLWLKGDPKLLNEPAVSLVGSRALRPENAAFAAEVGRQAALQGYVLVSGNARGADTVAQDSCLAHGGKVVSIIADRLDACPERPDVLYVSEDGFDMAFSAQRALSRNRLIHAMGAVTLVAQCRAGKGGTWSGTEQNLRKGYSPVFCFQDGSDAVAQLMGMGAAAADIYDLSDLSLLQGADISFFE